MGKKAAAPAVEEPAAEKVPGANYEITEVVLAYSYSNYYPAVVLRVAKDGDSCNYFLHFNGWNKKWDMWMPEDRIMKLNEENKAKAKEIAKKVKEEEAQKKKGSKRPAPKSDDSSKSSKKSKGEGAGAAVGEDEFLEEDGEVSKREIQVRIPGPLKKLLIVDWENITRNKKILALPRKNTVTSTLDAFLSSKTRNAKDMEVMTEVVKGLKKYFERALPAILLYKFERPQYDE
jgi:mortality factor 4-like protein 1